MCSLGTRDQSDWLRQSRWSRFCKFDIDTLMTQEFHHFSAVEAPLPVSPDNGM
jgi:hypothetical protein